MNHGLGIEVFSEIDNPEWIIPHWESILKENTCARLFETNLWIMNYWKFRCQDVEKLTFLVGKTQKGRIVGILPLSKKSESLVPFLSTWKCVHSTGEYESNWVCHPEYSSAFAEAVLDHLYQNRRRWYQVRMDCVWEGSSAMDAIRSECVRREFQFYCVPGPEIPFIPTTQEVSTIDEVLDGKYRRDMKRRQKKLEEINPLRFELYSGLTDLDSALDEFFTVEASGWKGSSGSAIVKNTSAEQFWRNLSHDAAERGLLRLHLLRLGDDVIAGQLGIVFGRTYYCLKVGYDEKYKQYGPGALMTRSAIQHCIEDQGVDVYDFAGAAMPYMNNWTNRTHKTWTIFIGSPHMALGGVFNLVQCGRRTLRPVWRSLKTMNAK